MVLRGLILLCPLPPIGIAVFSRFDGGGEGMVLQGWAPWCPLRGWAPWYPLTPLDTTVFVRLTVERRVWSYGIWYFCTLSLSSILLYSIVLTVEWRAWYGVWYCGAPPFPCDTAAFSRVDAGVESMAPRGLVLWCPLPSSGYCRFLSFGRLSRVYGPTGSGTVVPPPSLLILLYSLVLTGEGRVWPSGVWYGCAPSPPLDTAESFFGSSSRYYGITTV